MDILTTILIIAVLAIAGILMQMLTSGRKTKVKVKVRSEKIIEDPLDDEKLHRFTILNDSDRSIVIEAIRLYTNSREIFDNKHHPSFKAPEMNGEDVVLLDSKRIRDISELLSENFLGTTVMQPHEEMTYSYFLDETPDEMKITVKENEHIDIFLKVEFK